MTIPNYTPYARATLPGECSSITTEGGEWMHELPRRSGLYRVSSYLIGAVLGWACVIGFVMMVGAIHG